MKTSSPPLAPETAAPPSGKNPWALQSLPPFPAVALQLMSLLDDTEAPMNRIVSLLRVDPALSAEILRVSNSALYGLSRRIDNLSQAVVVLGTEVVKRSAITAAFARFSRSFMNAKGLRACWDHSVACALIAEQLAQAMNQPKDRAYTAGLLHDIGRLALFASHPVGYNNMFTVARESDFDELECERNLFNVDHCAAGAWFARSWNLPEEFVEAISQHHNSEPIDASLVSIVTAADRVANRIGFSIHSTAPEESVSELIGRLPLADPQAMAEKLENFADTIRASLAAITPDTKRVNA
jgi:putative nucleotidyltransferase with HDIG domain